MSRAASLLLAGAWALGVASPLEAAPPPAPATYRTSAAAKRQSSLDKVMVQRVVRGGMPRLRLCYQTALRRRPKLAGRMVVRFEIARSGRVTEVDIVEDELGDEPLARCVSAVFRGLQFPESPGAAIISYPLLFQPEG